MHDGDEAVLLHLGDDPGEAVARRLDHRRLVAGRRGLGEEPGEVGALDEALSASRSPSGRTGRRRPSAARCRRSRRAARRPGRRGSWSQVRDCSGNCSSHLQAHMPIFSYPRICGFRRRGLGCVSVGPLRPNDREHHHGHDRNRPPRHRAGRGPHAHRRRAGGSRVGQALRQHQPGHRGGARRGRRRVGRRHAARHRRGTRARSTRPTGRPTTRSARSACCSCRTRSRASRRSCVTSWSPRSAARSRSPTVRSSTRRSATR